MGGWMAKPSNCDAKKGSLAKTSITARTAFGSLRSQKQTTKEKKQKRKKNKRKSPEHEKKQKK